MAFRSPLAWSERLPVIWMTCCSVAIAVA